MNKNTSKAFSLSALVALTVVEGGLFSPVRADWQPVDAGTYPPDSAVEAKVETLPIATADYPSSNEVIKSNTKGLKSTRSFIWQAADGTTPPSSVLARLTATLNWPHDIQVSQARGGTRADSWVSVSVDDPIVGYGATVGVSYSYSATYNNATHSADFSGQAPTTSTQTLQKNAFVKQVTDQNGGTAYLLDTSLQLQVTNYAAVSSERTYDRSGNTLNLFVAKATSGATTVTPTTIVVP